MNGRFQSDLVFTLQGDEMSDIQFQQFIRTPFSVEAVKITETNIEELAKFVGEVRVKGDEKYIALDRRIVPNVGRAYLGWWLTRIGDNFRCYSPKIFSEQFLDMPQTQQATFKFSIAEDDSDNSVEVISNGNPSNSVAFDVVGPIQLPTNPPA